MALYKLVNHSNIALHAYKCTKMLYLMDYLRDLPSPIHLPGDGLPSA